MASTVKIKNLKNINRNYSLRIEATSSHHILEVADKLQLCTDFGFFYKNRVLPEGTPKNGYHEVKRLYTLKEHIL